MPARSVPNDSFAALEVELKHTCLGPGTPNLGGRIQMFGLPTVGECKPDPRRAEPVFLESDCVVEKLAYHAHLGIPRVMPSHYGQSSTTLSSDNRPCARYCPIFSISGASDTA